MHRTSSIRRSFAFLFDLFLLVLIWSGIDNLLSSPVFGFFAPFGFALCFCLYFALIESRTGNASLGKRIFKLSVTSGDLAKPDWLAIFFRAVVLALLVAIQWSDIVVTLFPNSPSLIMTLVGALGIGVVCFNACLAIVGVERLMLQDSLTNTRVVHADSLVNRASSNLGQRNTIKWLKPILLASWVIATFVALAALMGPAALQTHSQHTAEVDTAAELQGAIAERMNLRTQVEFRERYYFSGNSHGDTNAVLTLVVWIPFMAWDTTTVKDVVQIVLDEFTVPVGAYSSGQLELRTGTTGPFWFGPNLIVELSMS